MAYLDRANIGNAKIEGMNEELGLSDIQYNFVLSIFFVTYIIFGKYDLTEAFTVAETDACVSQRFQATLSLVSLKDRPITLASLL